MQQRQLRLGDILDDYCPRERRVTNHAVVAMVGEDVKQTRCTTCDAEHEYKHGKVPRQRRKNETAGASPQVAAGAPRRVARGAKPVASEPPPIESPVAIDDPAPVAAAAPASDDVETQDPVAAGPDLDADSDTDIADEERDEHDGPVHRPLIRATLPRPAGQTPERPLPEFTMRQPAGRPNRFRPRQGRGAQVFGHAGGNVAGRNGGRPQHSARPGGAHTNRQRSGRKRSK